MSSKTKELYLYFFAGIVFVAIMDFAQAVRFDPPLPQELQKHCLDHANFHSDCKDYVE